MVNSGSSLSKTFAVDDVFIIQSDTAASGEFDGVVDHAGLPAKRASAKRVTAVIPYFGYCSSGSKRPSRASRSAQSLLLILITKACADRVIHDNGLHHYSTGFPKDL